MGLTISGVNKKTRSINCFKEKKVLPKLLLLATTRDRPPIYLERLFNSLAAQDNKNFILLLGDQSQNGISVSFLNDYKGKFSFKIVKILPCGLSEARNILLGIAPKGYEWFTLTDDDCYYPPDCFSQFAKYQALEPSAAAFAGNPCETIEDCACSEQSLHSLNCFSAIQKAPSYVLFFRRTAFESVGLFDTCMGIGSNTPWQSGEETDILIRMIVSGFRVYRAKGINVLHDTIFKNPLDTKKIRSYGAGRMFLLVKHKYSIFFCLLNIAYPVIISLPHFFSRGPLSFRVYSHMFWGRLLGYIKLIFMRLKNCKSQKTTSE